MQTRTLDGLVFTRAEFLTLLAAVNPPNLIGIDEDTLLPGDTEKHKALIEQGVEQLRERGLLTTRGDTHLINDELILMAGVVGHPQMVTLLIKQTPELGLQQFSYYFAEGFIVEHTMPAPEEYRLASLPSLALWLDRMTFVLPVTQPEGAPEYSLSIPQPVLSRAQDAAQDGRTGDAYTLLNGEGVDEDGARALIRAMAEPAFSGSLAFLRTSDGEITAARDLALLQGEASAWAMYQPEPDAPVAVRTLAGNEVQEVLRMRATSV